MKVIFYRIPQHSQLVPIKYQMQNTRISYQFQYYNCLWVNLFCDDSAEKLLDRMITLFNIYNKEFVQRCTADFKCTFQI